MSSKKHGINAIIGQLSNTDGIYKFIEGMDIPKTTNSNGIFVNLSVLGDADIDLIYDFVSNIQVEGDMSHSEIFADINANPPLDTGADTDTDKAVPYSFIPKNKSKDHPTYPKVKLTALQKTILSIL